MLENEQEIMIFHSYVAEIAEKLRNYLEAQVSKWVFVSWYRINLHNPLPWNVTQTKIRKGFFKKVLLCDQNFQRLLETTV